MSLLLAATRDQALLAMVIEEAHQVAQAKHAFVGRTAIQKIMYFLKSADVPMAYRFDIHYYGPYCQEISRDIECLIADKVVQDQSKKTEDYSNYRPGPALQELLSKHQESLEPFRENIRMLVNALVPLKPPELELFATLDYVYRRQKATGGTGPWKEQVLKQFLDVKTEKFTRDEVEHVYDMMVKASVFDP